MGDLYRISKYIQKTSKSYFSKLYFHTYYEVQDVLKYILKPSHLLLTAGTLYSLYHICFCVTKYKEGASLLTYVFVIFCFQKGKGR